MLLLEADSSSIQSHDTEAKDKALKEKRAAKRKREGPSFVPSAGQRERWYEPY